jgi:hypothetical protein
MSKRPIPAAGAIVTAVLVLVFGNPPFVEWIRENVGPGREIDADGVAGTTLRHLIWPEWWFTTKGNMEAFIAHELRAVLVIAGVFGILAMLAKGIGSGGVALVVGWVAVILSAAFAAFLTHFISNISGSASALDAMAGGGTYGLFVGWIVGIGCTVAKRG